MVRADRVIMSVKELRRVPVIRQTMEKKLTQIKAGALLGLTARHVRRLLQRVRQEGDRGLVQRGRGKPSNRRLPEKVKAQALTLYAQRYGDFGPTLAVEQLAERHGIAVSAETLRGWLLAKGVTHCQRRKRPHRAWRARKTHVGELVQLDGSHHAWFEGRGPRCVLMAYIDDASSRVSARCYEYEGTIPAMDSFQRYVKQQGIPLAIDADTHTTYRSPAEPTIAEQLAGVEPTSQFGRALEELGVELIAAHSPPAKGRVERLPLYNRRFAVQPAQATDLHRPRPAGRALDRILCLQTTRCLRKDFTLAHRGGLYQIHDTVRAPHVLVEEHVDGTLRITHQGRTLGFHAITSRPVKAAEAKKIPRPRCPVTPRPDHPWRTRLRPERTSHAAAAGT